MGEPNGNGAISPLDISWALFDRISDEIELLIGPQAMGCIACDRSAPVAFRTRPLGTKAFVARRPRLIDRISCVHPIVTGELAWPIFLFLSLR